MTSRPSRLEIYNFTLTFGKDLVLLDLLDEVVIPAFLNKRVRNYGLAQTFFHETTLLSLNPNSGSGTERTTPTVGIAGRYIKDTILQSEQRYDNSTEKLVQEKRHIQSSPSAIFLLILNTHRLLYLREGSFSPNIESFAATAKKFVREAYFEFIEELHNNSSATYKSLEQQYPKPEINIVPLSNRARLTSFIDQYQKLETVEIKVTPTNAIDNEPFFDQLRDIKQEAGSRNTILKHENKTAGLNKDAIISQTEGLAEQADTKLTFRGKDKKNNTLKIDSDTIKISVPIDTFFEGITDAAKSINKKYKELIEQGTIAEAKIRHVAINLRLKLMSLLEDENEE